MDYSKLSGFEINCEVSKLTRDNANNPDSGYLVINDYCNNPADAWPIIHQHGISIAFDKNEDEWLAWGDFAFDQAGWDIKKEPEISCAHTNPLRAAMTVFLMMQESANVQANPARPDIR